MPVNRGSFWPGRSALLAATLLLAWPACATDLVDVYYRALSHDATLRAARAAADSTRERLPQARAQLLPNIAFSAARNRNDIDRELSRQPLPAERYYSSSQALQLRQPIYRKPLLAGLEQAAHLVRDADATLEREVQNLSVRVVSAYFDALLAQDQLDLVLRQKAFMLSRLDAARKSFAAGSGIRTDIDEAQARLDLNRAQELEARQQIDYARRQIETLSNGRVDQLARVDPARLRLLPPTPASLDAWIELAERASPEIRSLQARRDAARLEVEKARGGHHPTLDAVAQVARSSSENVTAPNSSYTNRSVGLQFNLPLYAGGQVDSAVRQAEAELLRATEATEAARRDLGLRLQREFRAITEGVQKIRALEQAARSAEQLVKSNRRSQIAGARTVVDILNAEQQQQQTLRELAQARYDYLVARVRLHALAGDESERVIEEINAWLAPAGR